MSVFSNNMMLTQSGAYTDYEAVDFDGANDYASVLGAFAGAVDGSTGIFATSFRPDGGDGTTRYMLIELGNNVFFRLSTTNKFTLSIYDAASINGLVYNSNATFLAGSGQHNVVASWSTNFTAGNKLIKVMIDGVADAGTVGDVDSAFSAQYTALNWRIGASLVATQKWDGCLAEMYFNTAAYMDVTQAANYAKFYSGGHPVNLGTIGQNPTGSQPIGFWHIPAGGTPDSWVTNLGSGGGMTLTGALDLCSSKP